MEKELIKTILPNKKFFFCEIIFEMKCEVFGDIKVHFSVVN